MFESIKVFELLLVSASRTFLGILILLKPHVHGVPLFAVLVTLVWHLLRVAVVGSMCLPNISVLCGMTDIAVRPALAPAIAFRQSRATW